VLLLLCLHPALAQTDPKADDKLKLTGTAGADLGLYNMSPGYLARGKNLSWTAYADLNLQWKQIQVPFSFIVSEQQRNFRQSFNHLGIAPTWRWIKLYAGYSNMTFSSTTLASATFLGAGVEMNPGHFRFGAMYGQLYKAVPENTDPTLSVTPSFRRIGYGFKIGVGKTDRYVDLIYFKAKDDSASIPPLKSDFSITPQENVILGINVHQKFSKKISWDLEGSTSVITRDTRASDSLDNTGAYSVVRPLININITTNLNFALKTSLSYTSKYVTLKGGFAHIDPHYTSLGAYFFRDDLQKIFLSPTFRLKKNKVLMALQTYQQHDNLTHSKRYTNNMLSAEATLSVTATRRLSIDLPMGIFDNYQTRGTEALNDTTRISMVNRHAGLSPRYTLDTKTAQHTVLLMLMFQETKDHNAFTRDYTENFVSNNNLTYSYTQINSQLNLTGSLEFGKSTNHYLQTSYYGISGGVSYPFLKKLLETSGLLAYRLQSFSTGNGAGTLLLDLDASYKYRVKHRFGLHFDFTHQTSASSVAGFTEVKTKISYAYKF